MNRFSFFLVPALLLLFACGGENGSEAAAVDASEYNGRWNLSVPGEARSRAWWLEVNGAGTGTPTGLFVGAPGGGMYEPDEMSIVDGEFVFRFEDRKYSLPDEELPWAERPPRSATYHAKIEDGKLVGWMQVDGHPETRREFTGERAPEIADEDDGTWKETEPVELFNGNDLSGWEPMVPGQELGWSVDNGILTNHPPANNLVSEREFWNFKLHAEYRLYENSNSGFGLRGRYEIQVLDDHGREPTKQGHGAVYYRIAPSENASFPPGEWQTMDVTLIGRDVTVVLNGKTVIDKQVIEGLTAMAHDPNEGEPGPISVQGDHRKIDIRKFTVTPLEKAE